MILMLYSFPELLKKRLKTVQIAILGVFKEMQSDLIESSDVCLSTCIGSSAWALQTADFPVVVIDEAGQCDEPTSLVPLMKGARHLTLIGDHKQLPSVVANPECRAESLNTSMFERLMLQGSEHTFSLLYSVLTNSRRHPVYPAGHAVSHASADLRILKSAILL